MTNAKEMVRIKINTQSDLNGNIMLWNVNYASQSGGRVLLRRSSTAGTVFDIVKPVVSLSGKCSAIFAASELDEPVEEKESIFFYVYPSSGEDVLGAIEWVAPRIYSETHVKVSALATRVINGELDVDSAIKSLGGGLQAEEAFNAVVEGRLSALKAPTLRPRMALDLTKVYNLVSKYVAETNSLNWKSEETFLIKLANYTFATFLSTVSAITYLPARGGFPTNYGGAKSQPFSQRPRVQPSWDGVTLLPGTTIPSWWWDESADASGLPDACLGDPAAEYNEPGVTGGVQESQDIRPVFGAPSSLWPQLFSLISDKSSGTPNQFPILFFTEDEYFRRWPPCNSDVGAQAIFLKTPNQLLPGLTLGAIGDTPLLERYPRAVVRFEYVPQVAIYNGVEIERMAIIPIIKHFLGDPAYAFGGSDVTVQTLINPSPPDYWPVQGKSVGRPCSWSSLAFDSDITLAPETPLINCAGMADIFYAVDQQVHGSSTLTFPPNKEYGPPSSCEYEGCTQPQANLCASRSNFNDKDVAVLRAIIQFRQLYLGTRFPGVTAENSSWLQGGSLIVDQVNEFIEITTQASQTLIYNERISRSELPRYLVDTSRVQLSMETPGGTVKWYPITKIYGDISGMVDVSCDGVGQKGTTRKFNGESYIASRNYDLRGRKGLYDIALLILHQYRLMSEDPGKYGPTIDVVMPEIIGMMYLKGDAVLGGKGPVRYKDIIAGMLTRKELPWEGMPGWPLGSPAPQDVLNPALYPLRLRLMDLDLFRLVHANAASWAFQSLLLSDFRSAIWLGSFYKVSVYLAEYGAVNRKPSAAVLEALAYIQDHDGSEDVPKWTTSVDLAFTYMWPVVVQSSDPGPCQLDVLTYTRCVGDFNLLPDQSSVAIATQMTYQNDKRMSGLYLFEDSDPAAPGRFYGGTSNFVKDGGFISTTGTFTIPEKVNQAFEVIKGNFGKNVCYPMHDLLTEPKYKTALGLWRTTLKGLSLWATSGLDSKLSASSRKSITAAGQAVLASTAANFTKNFNFLKIKSGMAGTIFS